jgi:hypothetical protein
MNTPSCGHSKAFRNKYGICVSAIFKDGGVSGLCGYKEPFLGPETKPCATCGHGLECHEVEGRYPCQVCPCGEYVSASAPTTSPCARRFEKYDKEGEFAKGLESLINHYSQENGSNTPDFILAGYLVACLTAFNEASKAREIWYGKFLHI